MRGLEHVGEARLMQWGMWRRLGALARRPVRRQGEAA